MLVDLLRPNTHECCSSHELGTRRNYYSCACACAAASLKSRESSVKRNVALIKRLRALSEDTCQAVLEDIDRVNQSKVPHLHFLLRCAVFC